MSNEIKEDTRGKRYYINIALKIMARNLNAKRGNPVIIVENIVNEEQGSSKVFFGKVLQAMLDVLTGKEKETYDKIVEVYAKRGWEMPEVPERLLNLEIPFN